MIRIRPLLAVAGLASILAVVGVTGPAVASTATTLASTTRSPQGAQTPVPDRSHPAPAASGNCASVRAHLSEYAARGAQRVACVTAGGAPARSAAVRPQAGYPVWCDSLTANTWWITRTAACAESTITYTLINTNTGAVIGTAEFSTAQDIEAAANNLHFTESDYLTLTSETGEAIGLSVTWATACSSPCTPAASEPWAPATPIALDETLHGSVALADTVAAGTLNYPTESYDVTVTQPGATVSGSATWGAPSLRCDNGVAVSNSSGCVEPDFTPVFPVSEATYGSSAVMILWAQTQLSGHWGLQGSGQPLHRLANSSEQAANRRVICNSSFVSGSTGVANDSCDEFPFAATYESGALNSVTSGAQCAQVTAVRTATTGSVAAQWANIGIIGTPTGSEKCVRGHIPLSLNSDTGGALGRFTVAQRLIYNDPYWVEVTS